MLSQGEQEYIEQGIQMGVRLDGRTQDEYRPVELELGVISTASGSARLHLGTTDVLVGIKADLGSPEALAPDCGRLQMTVECSSCASPEYMGRGGDLWSSQLARAVEASLIPMGPKGSAGVDLSSLSVVSGKSCWVLYLDALVLNDGGNVLGAISMAARAALANTRLPRVEVVMGEGDDSIELEIDEDPSKGTALDVARVPVIVPVLQVGRQSIVDPSLEEEACSCAAINVAVDARGLTCGVTSTGNVAVSPVAMMAMLERAQRAGPEIITALDKYLVDAAKKLYT